MKIDIFDVGHGACSVITAPNGKRVMVDCGSRSDEPYWWPSIHYFGEKIDALVLTNLDEDHVANFRNLLECVAFSTVWINPTIDAARLRSMKADGMGSGVSAVHDYLREPTALNLALDFSPLTVTSHYQYFGGFTDTNNLSLVTFVEYGQFSIVFPGDIEEEGWKRMLLSPDFRARLRRVNLFVASHHGRASGCCAEVFDDLRCNPHAFIISDKEMIHDTQETTNWYRQHAKGLVKILANPWDMPDTRYVFSTRKDRCMTIDVQPNGNFILYPNSDRQDKKSQLVRAATGTGG
jgi:beta-lactamase superfamily II metal-dependent hydrolase